MSKIRIVFNGEEFEHEALVEIQDGEICLLDGAEKGIVFATLNPLQALRLGRALVWAAEKVARELVSEVSGTGGKG